MTSFNDALGLNKDDEPFPWQEAMLEKLRDFDGNKLALDVPTGLGKTSVMAAWLVAVTNGGNLPRRLVYIVDRRAVVDQATREAERLREWLERNPKVKQAIGLSPEVSLPISTLRGQFADNREWLADPSSPAIVVGTVDMVGSRLLFEGYGVSRKMRPYHAGFLGADTLFVLDEAHLVPPFEELLKSVVSDAAVLRGSDEQSTGLIPRTMLLSLSATGRSNDGDVLQITDDDIAHPVARKRLKARKRLSFVEEPEEDPKPLHERLADEAWALSGDGTKPLRVIVFSNSRDTAQKANDALLNLAKTAGQKDVPTQLFVGSRRVRERQQVETWLAEHGFLAGHEAAAETAAFVFATSAGEVGVDLDADHMASDLVAFERMVQRFGRVNRRGEGDAEIRILLERDKPNDKERKTLDKALAKSTRERNRGEHEAVRQFDLAIKYRTALEQLPRVEGEFNASPNAFRELKQAAETDEQLSSLIKDATTPNPLRPELTRPILDSWSMTSLENHSARPKVAPWLRGWIDDEPQTTVVWRRYLPTLSRGCSDASIRDFFENAPVHLTEKLETPTDSVLSWLLDRAKAVGKQEADEDSADGELQECPAAIVFGEGGEVIRRLDLSQLVFNRVTASQNDKRALERELRGCTIVVDCRLGGLKDGLLAPKETTPATAADLTPPPEWMRLRKIEGPVQPVPSFQVRQREITEASGDPPTTDFKIHARPKIFRDGEEEPSSEFVIWKHRKATTSEDSRSTLGERGLDNHHKDTEQIAVEFANRLKLPPNHALALRIAARNHDHGKNCDLWQDAFSAPPEKRPLAKTNGPLRVDRLHRYRHEFGSLPAISKDPEFDSLSPELQDLVIHLVAAHHGFARPVIRTDGANEPPTVLEDRAQDVALRFARLQKRWGPWGLAWLESLLRAADQTASRMIADKSDTANTADPGKQEEITNG